MYKVIDGWDKKRKVYEECATKAEAEWAVKQLNAYSPGRFYLVPPSA